MAAGFMTHVTCRPNAKNRDQLRNPTLGNQVWATFTFYIMHLMFRVSLDVTTSYYILAITISYLSQSTEQHIKRGRPSVERS